MCKGYYWNSFLVKNSGYTNRIIQDKLHSISVASLRTIISCDHSDREVHSIG